MAKKKNKEKCSGSHDITNLEDDLKNGFEFNFTCSGITNEEDTVINVKVNPKTQPERTLNPKDTALNPEQIPKPDIKEELLQTI